MKNFFLFLMVIISALSCKKEAKVQDIITTSNESLITNSNVTNGAVTGILKVELVLNVRWYSFYEDCLPSWWYCWKITSDARPRSYIKINNAEKLITFGIDNSINTDYHRKFIEGSNFNFPYDTYIRSEIVKAAIGIDKEINIKKGPYHFDNIEGILTITAPYSIVD